MPHKGFPLPKFEEHVKRVLRIHAERQEKEQGQRPFPLRIPLWLLQPQHPLPDGVKEEDIAAKYTNGVLEVRAPLPEAAQHPFAQKKLPMSYG